MRDFIMGGLSTFCLACAGFMFLATSETSFAKIVPAPVPNCSIPAGGCAPVLGGGCRGQCTDNIPNNDIACSCEVPPTGPLACYCEAYDPIWGG